MRRMFVWLFVTLLCMQVSSVFAQDAKILEKSHKDLIKSLKKQYGLKDVSVKVEQDGFWYFLLTKKDGLCGVADQSGTVIIPIENVSIEYYPAEPAGVCVEEKEGLTNVYYYDKTTPVFLVSYGNYIHNISGKSFFYKKIISTTGKSYAEGLLNIKKIKGFWLISESSDSYVFKKNVFSYDCHPTSGKSGIINGNGEILLPLDFYNKFNFGGLRVNVQEANEPRFNVCIYSKYIDGKLLKGGISLNGKAPNVPCLFDEVKAYPYHHNEYFWEVRLKPTDKLEQYDPNKNYNLSFRDKGEELFQQNKYTEVIDFYAKEGITAPWAKFYTAQSLRQKTYSQLTDAFLTVENIEKNKMESFFVTSFMEKEPYHDFDSAIKQYQMAIRLFNEYLKEDETFASQARISSNMCQDYIDDCKKMIEGRYFKAKQKAENYRKEIQAKLAQEERLRQQKAYEETRKRQQEAQQRETEIMMGILKIFANALAGNSGSSSSSYSSGSGTYNSTTTTSGSSSKGINQSKLADWQSRKANAERLLEDYREQLRRDPDNAALKSKIRSQEGVLRTCNEQISLIESGQIR